jgi:steroid delta-isomerase-like uncharacterized protein
MKHSDTVLRMIDAIQAADIEAFSQLFREDAIMHHPLSPSPLEGRAAIRESEQALFSAFSGIVIDVVNLIGTESTAAVEVVLRARNTGPLELGPGNSLPATQRRIELPAAWFYAYDENGLIRIERDYFDTALLMAQLGLMAE